MTELKIFLIDIQCLKQVESHVLIYESSEWALDKNTINFTYIIVL